MFDLCLTVKDWVLIDRVFWEDLGFYGLISCIKLLYQSELNTNMKPCKGLLGCVINLAMPVWIVSQQKRRFEFTGIWSFPLNPVWFSFSIYCTSKWRMSYYVWHHKDQRSWVLKQIMLQFTSNGDVCKCGKYSWAYIKQESIFFLASFRNIFNPVDI